MDDVTSLLRTPQHLLDLHERWLRDDPAYREWCAFADKAKQGPALAISAEPIDYREAGE